MAHKEGGGIKNVQKTVYMVYEWPFIQSCFWDKPHSRAMCEKKIIYKLKFFWDFIKNTPKDTQNSEVSFYFYTYVKKGRVLLSSKEKDDSDTVGIGPIKK